MVSVVFTVLAVLSVLTAGKVPQLDTGACVLTLPYALFRWGSGREAVIGSVIVFLKAGLSDLPDVTPRPNAGLGFAVLFSVMALGAVFRFRAGARMRELDRAKLLERERLARDLHDTVAHHVSAIAIRAQAGLATAASRPDAAVEALRVIEAEASSTLTQMRSMVRVLRRNEPAELAPSPCIADLERLAGRDGAGLPVDVEVRGDFADVLPSVGAAIYRSGARPGHRGTASSA
jgi:signal transduction histidine kinase